MTLKNKIMSGGMLRKWALIPVMILPIALLSFKPSATATGAKKELTLVLDAGHGGIDKGAVADNGTEEKVMVQKICGKIAQLAPDYNVRVVTTRSSDKYATLSERVALANKESNAVFLSVHINKAEKGHEPHNGYEVLVSNKNSKPAASQKLATAVMGELASSGVAAELREKNLQVLRENQHPAIAIEWGNIDNAGDMARIQNDAELTTACTQLLEGLVAFANAAE